MNLPPGVRFDPTDRELLEGFLKPKIYGQKLESNIVGEKEIYGPDANPWHIFNANSSTPWIVGNKFEKTVYAFTRLIKKAAVFKKNKSSLCSGREQYVKKAGCGTWQGVGGSKEIMDRKGENVIGIKKLLVYQVNDIGGLGNGINIDQVGYWKMNQYSLCGFDEYVICQITWDISKTTKVVSLSSRSCTSRKRKCSSQSQIDTPLGMNDHDDYMVQEEGRGNWMNTDPDLQVSTSCPDFLEEHFAELYINSLSDQQREMFNKFQEFSATLSSFHDNNNDKHHPTQNYPSQVSGRRNSSEAGHLGKKLCI